MKRLILLIGLTCAMNAHAQSDSVPTISVQTDSIRIDSSRSDYLHKNKHAIRLAGEAGLFRGVQLNGGMEYEYRGFFAGFKRNSCSESVAILVAPREISYTSFGLGYNYRSSPNFGFMASLYIGKGEVIDASLRHDFLFFFSTVIEKYPTYTRDLSCSVYYKYYWFMLKGGLAIHQNDYFDNLTLNLGVAFDIDF